jgi:signal transduction histidine kinase
MLFPEDKMFVDMKIKAYQGTVVFGIDGTPLGHIFAFHDQPDAAPQGHREFLRVIADWVSLEFRRRHAEEQKDAAEKELRQHQKLEAIGQLAGGIAHEINTPIQYIGDNLRFLDEANHSLRRLIDAYRSLAQAAETQGILQEEQRELAGAIAEIDLDYYLEETPRATSESLAGIVQVSSIVSAMKEFSHPSTVIKGPVDINHILENSVTVSRSEWREVAEIKYGLAPDLPRPLGMAGELGQVFLNVIVNAAHAIKLAQRGPGTITIRTHANQDSVEIDIEDTGTGIPVEIRERIFDPFFTTKDVGQGTGQGLTFSHDIVTRKHGGSLTFTTETGKGTCFTIRLPIAKKA